MNTILVTTDGPLECRGLFEITDAQGNRVATETETWLCRCGGSANKPYCDGSHRRVEFKDATVPETAAPSALPGDAEALRVTLRANGPLRLDGSCEVVHPTAGVIFAGEQTALCRCGQSAKKPFCDGTHRQIGFTT